MHQDEADLAAGGAAPPYPGFIPGGSALAGGQLMRRPWGRGYVLKDPERVETPVAHAALA